MADNAQDYGWPQTAGPSVYSAPSVPSNPYFESLKATNPAAYAQIAKLAAFTANENYGGVPQDYQAQIFTPLSADVLAKAKSTEGLVPQVETYDNDAGSGSTLVGYTKDLGKVNGIPLTANYDASGNLTGYQGDTGTRSFLNGSHSVSGAWDASGKPVPQSYSSSGGGFLGSIMSDPILGTIANLGAAYFGGPLGSAALAAAQGKSPEDIAKSAALSYGAGQIAGGVGDLTGSSAVGQFAGNTGAGLLSGQDLGTSLTNAAINTGANQAASGLLSSAPDTTQQQSTTDSYTYTPSSAADYTGADYGYNSNTGGLGLQADLAPYDSSNPYSLDATNTGGQGFFANLAPYNPSNPYSLETNFGNQDSMGGGTGIQVPAQPNATLGSIGADASAAANEATPSGDPTSNPAGTGLLAGLIKSIFTGSSPTGAGNMATQGNNYDFSSLFGGLLGGAGNLMQGSTNVAARQEQANALRAAGQQAATSSQFRPVGTTTRFGSSNFQIDPATGQLQSAGYNLSPEMLGYQNRLSGLASQGLTQAEGAQGQYAPLQQGAQSMFGLGSQYLNSQQGQPVTDLGQQYMQSQAGAPLTQAGLGYLNQSPQAAAQDWYGKQQALLNPSRDVESARLANQLQQTGRTGVSVAQGGNLGAANPEQQALANARAMQDAQLAAQAGQYGLQQQQAGANLYGQGNALTQGAQVAGAGLYGAGQNLTQQGKQFGAGLFGTGAQNLGNYYSGQTAAMSPYNSAIAGVTGLEQAGQQPFNMSADLAAQFQKANAQGGALNLNAQTAAANAMLPANQYNPYASLLSGAGGNNQLTNALGGMFGNTGIGSSIGNYLSSLSGSNLNNAASNYINQNPDTIPYSTFNGSGDASWMNDWWMQ
jgi:hypothetical protein